MCWQPWICLASPREGGIVLTVYSNGEEILNIKNHAPKCQARWYILLTPAFGKQIQGDFCKLKASLFYILCLTPTRAEYCVVRPWLRTKVMVLQRNGMRCRRCGREKMRSGASEAHSSNSAWSSKACRLHIELCWRGRWIKDKEEEKQGRADVTMK